MERALIEKRFKQLEFYSFCGLLLFLPNSESLKQISFYLCFAGAMGWRFSIPRVLWRRPDATEWLLLGLLFVSMASTAINWPLEPGTKGLRNTLCMVFLFWLMYREEWSELQLRRLLMLGISATVVGLIIGIWEWKTGLRIQLEFHAAGVVTQSSIFLAIMTLLMLGFTLDKSMVWAPVPRIWLIFSLLFSFFCLLMMGSRGALLGFAVPFIMSSICNRKNRRLQIVWGVAIAITAGAIGYSNLDIRENQLIFRLKHLTNIFWHHGMAFDNIDDNDQIRLDHWRLAYAQATQGQGKLLGIGPRNFTSIRADNFHFEKPLKTYKKIWTIPQHAHNLFLTKWCEEGIVGLIVFILFLGHIGTSLIRFRPAKGGTLWKWTAALGALLAPVIAGSFNSAFGNEFSWLAMMLMGLWMGSVKNMVLNY